MSKTVSMFVCCFVSVSASRRMQLYVYRRVSDGVSYSIFMNTNLHLHTHWLAVCLSARLRVCVCVCTLHASAGEIHYYLY